MTTAIPKRARSIRWLSGKYQGNVVEVHIFEHVIGDILYRWLAVYHSSGFTYKRQFSGRNLKVLDRLFDEMRQELGIPAPVSHD